MALLSLRWTLRTRVHGYMLCGKGLESFVLLLEVFNVLVQQMENWIVDVTVPETALLLMCF